MEKNPGECCVCRSKETVQVCSGCRSAEYCSKGCQKSHWSHHGVYCNAIRQLEKLEEDKVYGARSVREELLDFRKQTKIAKVVGNKPMLSCWLGGKSVEVLWDTGSQVSLVDRPWLDKYFPDEQIFPVTEFLAGEDLVVRAANKGEIPFDGVVLLRFSLKEGVDGGFFVPVLVMSQQGINPIIGYNVIEHLVVNGTMEERESLKICLKNSSPGNVDALISLIEHQASSPDFLAEIKSQKTVTIPAGCRLRVQCRVKVQGNSEEQTVYFEPKQPEGDGDLEFNESVARLKRGRTNYIDVEVINQSRVNKVLRKGDIVGSVHSVSAVIPMLKTIDAAVSRSRQPVEVNAVNAEETSGDDDDLISKFDLSHLTKLQQQIMRKMLEEVKNVFSKSETDIGDIKDFEMEIELTDNVPVKEAYRKIPRHMYSEVKNYIDDLVANGWVRQSCSSYSSPIVCVRKKDGGMRLCIDYRRLNAKTVADAQPIPRIQDILDSLGGKRWFTTLDMSRAYHQGYVSERFRHLTAFSTPWTLLEWIRIPFGLRNSPPAFQRYINKVLGDLKGTICEPYLDDILVHSETFDQHVQDLKKVLLRLLARGVKLRGGKCLFAKQEVRYLGRLISHNGYRPDPEDTAALERLRTPPGTIGELRSMLGFLGYYRTYVKNFASWVKPMYDLLKGKCSGKKDALSKEGKQGQSYNSREKISWTPELQKILDGLLDYLKSPEVIAYPDYNLPFFLTTDASGYGLGSVLYQTQNGIDRVIGYASRTLSEAEKRYHFHSGKLEFLALKWSVTDRFGDYLQFGPLPFVVYTDNNPLTYILTSAKLNAVALRWVNDLADYNFTIKYRPGKINTDADYLSRQPMNIEELKRGCTESVDPRCLNAVFTGVGEDSGGARFVSVSQLSLEGEGVTGAIPRDKLIQEQKIDKVIGPVYKAVLEKKRPGRRGWKELGYESKLLMQEWNKLKLVNNVLMRETSKGVTIVLPLQYRDLVYKELHDRLAHLGADRVLELARQRFFWPKMARDIQIYVRKKCRCIADKRPNVPERAKLMSIESSSPFEVVAIDFIHLDKCKGGFEYVLVVTDLFTKFVQMYGTRRQTSKAAASKLFHEYILSYGFPKRIMHDRGEAFNSGLFKELQHLTGIQASNTTPYHPMSNGQCERMNRSLISMLKSLSPKQKQDWKSVLPHLSFAYNSTQHASTGFSPFFMMFGRESRLPIDEVFDEVQVDKGRKLRSRSHQEFVDQWKSSMQEAFNLAKEKKEKCQAYNKEKYDGKVKEIAITTGDHVLVKNLREKGGTGKLRSHWEHQIFEVQKQQGDLPVYQVRSLKNPKDVRVLHRNHLMKCEELPIDVFEEKPTTKEETVRERKVIPKPKKGKRSVRFADVEPSSDSDENDVELVVYPGEQDPVVQEGSHGFQEDEEVLDLVLDTTGRGSPQAEDSPAVEEEREEMDDAEEDEDEDVEEERPARRSGRNRVKTKLFTYDSIGGDPSYMEVPGVEDRGEG